MRNRQRMYRLAQSKAASSRAGPRLSPLLRTGGIAVCVIGALTAAAVAQSSVTFVYNTTTTWQQVRPGEKLEVAGRGFPGGASGRIHWQDPQGSQLAVFTAARDGTFKVNITIPPDAAAGPASSTACIGGGSALCKVVATAKMTVAGTTPGPATSPADTTRPGTEPGTPTASPTPSSPAGPQGVTGPKPTNPPHTLPPPDFQPPIAALPSPTQGPQLTSDEQIANLKIPHLEITQGLQDLYNSFPLVRNRRTWVRVYVETESTQQAGVMAALEGVKQTGEGPESLGVLFAENNPVTAQSFHPKITNGQRLNHGAIPYFRLPDEWARGTVKFRAWVWKGDPKARNEPSSQDNLFETQESFDTARDLRVFLFGLYLHREFDPDQPAEIHTILDPWIKAFSHLRRLLPVGGLSAVPYPFVFGDSGSHWDLRSDEGDPHEPRQALLEWHEMAGLPENDVFTGMVSPDPAVGGLLSFKGLSWAGDPANWVVMSNSWRPGFPWAHVGGGTWAHELGHSMGVDHAPCQTKEGVNHAAEISGGPIDWSFPSGIYGFPDCSLAPTDPEGYYGFDPRPEWVGMDQPAVLSNDPATSPPNVAWPWMGYKHPGWLDPWHGCQMLKFLDVACDETKLGFIPGGDAPGGGTVPHPAPGGGKGVVNARFQCHILEEEEQFCQTFTDTVPPDSAEVPDDLLISGFIDPAEGSGQITSIVEIPAPPRRTRPSLTGEASGKGPYLLALRGSDGKVKWAQFVRGGGTGFQEGAGGARQWFAIRIPKLPGAGAVQLVAPARVLAEAKPSSGPPAASITSAGVRAGSLEVNWRWSDPDGDPLIGHLFYRGSPTQPWKLVGHRLAETSFKTPAASLPGGRRAHVRLVVSDGFRSASAVSRDFTIDNKKPLAAILSPAPGESRPEGRAVDFEALAFDPEDQALDGEALVWRSSRDGPLGTGERLSLSSLSRGKHTVTLSATDSAGVTSGKKVEITIGPGNLPAPAARDAIGEVFGIKPAAAPAGRRAFPFWPAAAAAGLLIAGLAIVAARRRKPRL